MELFFRKPIRKLICYIKIIKKHAKEVFQIYYYIYLTENLVTGRKYIGKRKCKCKTDEDTYLGIGKFDAASNPDFYNIALGGDGEIRMRGCLPKSSLKFGKSKASKRKGKIIQIMKPPLPIKRVLKYLIHLDDYILFQKTARDTESLELTTLALKRFGA